MANSNEANTQLSSSDPKLEHPETPNQRRDVSTRFVSLPWFTLIIILALIALGGALYAIYANTQLHQQMTVQNNSLLTALNTIKQQQTENTNQAQATINTLQQAQNTLKDKLTLLEKNLHSAMQQRFYQTKDWMLLKARYYLQLAQINAHWSNNTQTTIALLQQADKLLSITHDQRLFAVRQAIAKEITEAQAIPDVDIAGLLSRLDAAQNLVNTIPIKKSVIPSDDKQQETPSDTTPSAWRERLKESVGLLEKLVVIRRHDETMQPLLTTTQEAMLRENIRLNLQEAQWAILQNNETIYKIALNQALKSIQNSFKQNAPTTKALIIQLQAMQQASLIQKKPTIETSLSLLNQFIESNDSQADESTLKGDNS
ncbi:uroporphyrinogen-III C-methyltransferase [Legionella oakridgensis]|uniref:Enzyme of heme biosynthesis n=2 Tax=Legionella oakridgensis TaxID=29423 RepID=W0B865_9GAMM|nr:uroporphyrinogen-III C-methyltransferase [Legionella oakridgensis]AHE66065.1 enzyme of heme biosynthesis [Legionella oakridgensis ATCC 33761 = DSM 21215]ETO94132.1 enzyme of heme biosynthesis [Legionella oakridgensis RV-2-2007]KTD43819.1 uroporphyrinogen III methylase HemX [Legionella oakridgensis]STY15985.1 uroporphyrinogen III methylase HemX [Legionella longbeachae]